MLVLPVKIVTQTPMSQFLSLNSLQLVQFDLNTITPFSLSASPEAPND